MTGTDCRRRACVSTPPYDTDAHDRTKNGTEWSGYRVHYTETCEEQRPEIVVHVACTIAPVQDDLARTALVPAEHPLPHPN
ncbi:hypothetical protein ACWCQK_41290 [Streptomyces sp. NPDC002306]